MKNANEAVSIVRRAIIAERRATERQLQSAARSLRAQLDRVDRSLARLDSNGNNSGVLNVVGELQGSLSAFEAGVGAWQRLTEVLEVLDRETGTD